MNVPPQPSSAFSIILRRSFGSSNLCDRGDQAVSALSSMMCDQSSWSPPPPPGRVPQRGFSPDRSEVLQTSVNIDNCTRAHMLAGEGRCIPGRSTLTARSNDLVRRYKSAFCYRFFRCGDTNNSLFVLSQDREANLCQVVRRAPLRALPRVNTRRRSQQMVGQVSGRACEGSRRAAAAEAAAQHQSHW